MSFASFATRAILLAAAVAASPLASSVAQAQSTQGSGPTVSAATIGARRSVAPEVLDSRGATAALQQRRSHGQATALMIVGGAAVVTGALVGGDAGTLLIVGGAVAGLYGLYLYLR